MFVCLSAYLSVWLGVCLPPCLSVSLSGLFYPDRPGTLPALCHMISLEAAGVKLIWSGLKAYERLMLHINCSHLNSPFPPLQCPSCPYSASNLLILTKKKKQNKTENVKFVLGLTSADKVRSSKTKSYISQIDYMKMLWLERLIIIWYP